MLEEIQRAQAQASEQKHKKFLQQVRAPFAYSLQKARIFSDLGEGLQWPKRFGFATLCPGAPLNDNSFLMAQAHHQNCGQEKKTETFEKEEEHTFGKRTLELNFAGLSTASEEHSSGDDSSFVFSKDLLGATMKGTPFSFTPGSFEADMIDDEFNSD